MQFHLLALSVLKMDMNRLEKEIAIYAAIAVIESALSFGVLLYCAYILNIIIIVYLHKCTYVWITYTECFLQQHMYNCRVNCVHY